MLRPDTSEPYPFEVDFFSLRYRGDLSHYIDWNVFMYGSYEYSELSLLKEVFQEMKRRRESVNFFGANVGHHRNSGMGTLVSDHGDGFAAPIKVAVRNGDRLFDEHSLPRLDILKIDVEGFEPFALRGLSHHIRKDRPVILTELSDSTRRNLGSESEFRQLFYEGALFAEVSGRDGCKFEIRPFSYATSHEVLVVPAEWTDFLSHNGATNQRIAVDGDQAASK